MLQTLISVITFICQMCGVVFLAMVLFKGTKIGQRFEQWIRSNKKTANVFVILSVIGIVISLFRSIFY